MCLVFSSCIRDEFECLDPWRGLSQTTYEVEDPSGSHHFKERGRVPVTKALHGMAYTGDFRATFLRAHTCTFEIAQAQAKAYIQKQVLTKKIIDKA